jgi:hypothetical protein
MSKRLDENLDEYGDRLSKMPDSELLREVRSLRHRPRAPIVDMVVMEFCLKHLALPKNQRVASTKIVVTEPKKYSYEEE